MNAESEQSREGNSSKTVLVPARTVSLFDALGVVVPMDITQNAVVDSILTFANGDATPPIASYMRFMGPMGPSPENFGADELLGMFMRVTDDDESSDTGYEIVDKAHAERDARERIAEARKRAREMLSDASEGVDAISRRIFNLYKGQSSEVELVPTVNFSPKDKRVRLSWRMRGPDTADGWIKFAAFVIADQAVDGKTCIGHCKWSKCGRFFRVMVRGRGKPAREYCPGTDHREQARLGTSTERVRDWRKRKRAAELRRRRLSPRN